MAGNVTSQEPPGGRWMMVVIGIIIQLCLGAIYAYGAVRGDISAYFKTLMAIADPATKGPSAFDMTNFKINETLSIMIESSVVFGLLHNRNDFNYWDGLIGIRYTLKK